MKIALCFPGCYRRGGVERVVLAAANGLASSGHEVHVFSRQFERNQLGEGVIAHTVRGAARPPAWALARFPQACLRTITESGIDFDIRLGFGVACPACDLAWVQSVHARWMEVSTQGAGGTRIQRWRRSFNPFHRVALWLESHRFGAEASQGGHDRLLALTPEVKKDLQRFYGVTTERLSVLPNGFDPVMFNPARARALRPEARSRFGLTAEDKVAVFVANEWIRKGLPDLLRATAILAKREPNLRVLAVGRLPEAQIMGAARRWGVFDRLILGGAVDDVALAYAAGDVFVLPTRYEAWGLVIVEALACGLPVVTSQLAGASVAVPENETSTLLSDPTNVDTLVVGIERGLSAAPVQSEQPPSCVSQYSWSMIVAALESQIEAWQAVKKVSHTSLATS